MTITEILALRSRKKVAWLGIDPPDDGRSAFRDREFVVEQCSPTDLESSAYLAGLSAVVFMQSSTKLVQVTYDLKKYSRQLLDYGCTIIVRPIERPALKGISVITGTINELQLPTAGLPHDEVEKLGSWQRSDNPVPLPRAHVYGETVSWQEIANFIATHPPDRPPAPDGELTLVVKNDRQQAIDLDSSSDLLVRRAFADCSNVELVSMVGGRSSGVSVFRAHATLRTGGFPLPYFVKLGDRAKIHTEYQNYIGQVQPYIPFHLGPHLALERCCLGMNNGVIVGDYVDESESLRRCASKGRATPAIAGLFERTLRGWHRSAHEEQRSLAEVLGARFPEEIARARIKRAHQLGAKRSLKQLRKLFEYCNAKPVLVGPTHGDLHAGNVRVRATDAIIIDFGEHHASPLVYDAASLEASLLVDGFSKKQEVDIQTWLESINDLYACPPLAPTLPHPDPKNPSYWFHSCVQQIRLHARPMERAHGQYAAALAMALLIKAKKDSGVRGPEASRRAAAYVLAERVLSLTFA